MKLKKQKKCNSKGAGFVLHKKTPEGVKVIVLIKPSGKFDLPKGHADPTDIDSFATAQRECFEETGIFVTKSNLVTNKKFVDNQLTIFCAETDQDPNITENPETGKLEHIAYILVDHDVACKILPKYLAKAVQWSCIQQKMHT